jgi:acyl-CoA dehydrogenase
VRPVPPFTERHEALRAEMRAFVERELRPHAPEWEAARCFPTTVFGQLAERGWLGLKYGPDADWVADAVLCEELPRAGSGGLSAGIGAHVGIATPPLATFGSEPQRERWLAPAIRGEKIAALAITEPDTGSDVAAIRTRAERVDGGWLVNGEKTFITNGVRAHFYVTAVRTTPEGGHAGMSFLVVERGDGVTTSRLDKLGWHASDTATIAFQDVFVPEEHLLGELDKGFYLVMANFQGERLGMSLAALGEMRATFDGTVAWAAQQPRSQARRHALAELATLIEASAAIAYGTARRMAAGEDAVREVTMAKLLTQRACFELMDACLQIHGGAGYMREYWVERAARDARLGPIGGGSDEIMREILGRTLAL